ncbi:MAG TPA: flagellar biosynthesis anti-sigma factor FlgM [Acidobacteriaceae bacterium]|nr:flagellar biosynthesis anti-sigma factor FlgM [Acidobacteriaceae bacterium]
MSDSSRVGVSMEANPATPVGLADGIPPASRTGLTETDGLIAKPLCSGNGIEEIADDAERVSLAGMLISQASTGSDVRFEKVAALRRTIEAGTYDVPVENVARKLMGEMQKK